jgi:hypothetical protein
MVNKPPSGGSTKSGAMNHLKNFVDSSQKVGMKMKVANRKPAERPSSSQLPDHGGTLPAENSGKN